jgi:hypothetical protein
MFGSKSTGGFYDPEIHTSMPEDVVELPEGLHAALMAGQSEGKVISWGEDGFPFLADQALPTADQIWLQIKAERDRRKALGVKVGNIWFHSDDASRIQQLALVIMGANMPAGIQWKSMGEEFALMTPTLAMQIFTATATLDQTLFAKATEHRLAMEASAVPSEYDFSTGWPAFYQE